ncbi:MAG: hypothetical protein HYZ40_08490 [Rhodospirillales bacterium]|nr:hypothetical protein [Rhodospirillales bacterium]
MALDVYVGSLAHYYAGAGYRIAHADAAKDHVKDPERIHAAVLAWRTALSGFLGDNIPVPLDWDETPGAPHFTGQPGWDGLAALVLWAAYAEHPSLRRPDTLSDEWENDLALARSNADGFRSRYSHLVRHVELWLPNSFPFTFDGVDVDGHRVVIGSSPTLRRQLADLNGATWKAGDGTVAGWRRKPPSDDASLEARARYGFAAMVEAAQRAVDLRLPMKLTY